MLFVIVLFFLVSAADAQESLKGLSKEKLVELYTKQEERTYRSDGSDEWITFNHRVEGQLISTITFTLRDNAVTAWNIGDRAEVVREYLSEFCSKAFIHKYQNIYKAIASVLENIPHDVFLAITDRARPVVFTEVHSSGTGRLANSADIIVLPDDPPTFAKGLWVIKLNTELNEADSFAQIEGVVAHELAHRALGHSADEDYDETIEMQANKLIIEWGFKEEFRQAGERFGTRHKHEADKPLPVAP